MANTHSAIARSEATKQSSRLVPHLSRTWIATPGFAGLAMTLPARAVSGLIWVYQRTLSPALVVISPTCGCRFAPTCSHYAREALHEHGLLTGLVLTVRRLVKCGPWHPGGLDPVPPSPRLRRTGPAQSRPSCNAVRHGI